MSFAWYGETVVLQFYQWDYHLCHFWERHFQEIPGCQTISKTIINTDIYCISPLQYLLWNSKKDVGGKVRFGYKEH